MKTETVFAESLKIHPLLQQMPEPSPELLASMTSDFNERGIDQPLIVDEKDRVMDGLVRLRAALAFPHSEVPIVRRSSADAATIIVQSLLQRRHYSKSALAYLAFPLFAALVEESRHRRVANLKRGDGKPDSTQTVLSGKTAEDIARNAGISRALFFQAAEVHKLFKKHPKAKELLEPQILAGELSLGYAINGVAGQVATKGHTRGESEQLDLFQRGISALRVRFSKWNLLPQKSRLLVANEFAEAVADAPDEVQERVLAAIAHSRKAAR